MSDISDVSDNSSDNILFKQFTSAYNFLNKYPNINFSNDIKLKLYGTYKSATIGSCNVPKPSLLDFRARAKWDAWKEFDGISKEEAMNLYVDIVEIANIGWNKSHVVDDSEDDEDIEEIIEENVQSASQDRWTYVSTLSYEEDDNVTSDDIFSHVKQGKFKEVSKMLDSDKEKYINIKDSQGLSLLHWACDRGHLEIVKLLIERGSNINILTNENETPFHYACLSEHLECSRYLYKNNVDITIKDKEGLTALEQCDEEFKQLVIQD
ncbi:hypothetical protein Glove_38g34 [Diversispora epigaea]|uniref:ACB domain-containing protein n=1 Tax=Diversispora epigaea TaxID=1348612 RepID=A0A397JPX4_9GLOM|nr:hypothetical protein Glove_38g34 [Diversispora epigaea]